MVVQWLAVCWLPGCFISWPPGNRVEALRGGRKGQHSIRVNDKFRICFRWTVQGPENVEIVDYH